MSSTSLQSAGGQLLRPGMCAFSVYLDDKKTSFNAANAATTVPYSTNGTVLFDRNNDFDISNNKFTAPVTGLYMMNQALRVDDLTVGKYVVTTLMEPGYSGNGGADNEHASRSVEDIIYSQMYDGFIASNTSLNTLKASNLIELQAGQEVRHIIYVQDDTSVTLNDRVTSFSGYLVG